MSRIGQYALAIQEQANELGYSTIQEALDDNYEVIDDILIKKVDSKDALVELEKAHEEWIKEKEHVIKDLNRLLRANLPLYQLTIIKKTIQFLEKGEQ